MSTPYDDEDQTVRAPADAPDPAPTRVEVPKVDDEATRVDAPSGDDEATRVDAGKPKLAVAPLPPFTPSEPRPFTPSEVEGARGEADETRVVPKAPPAPRPAPRDDEERSIVQRVAKKAREPVPLSVLILVLTALAFMLFKLWRDHGAPLHW